LWGIWEGLYVGILLLSSSYHFAFRFVVVPLQRHKFCG
jgi:hypothetical protein